jgi:phosphate transport system substrate-binding protein
MRRTVAGAILSALAVLGVGASRADELSGTGSSFVKPILNKWIGTYAKEKGQKVDYTATGSTNGIKQLIEKAVDFGCTDVPLSDDQLAKAKASGGEVVHVPLVLGGVVPAYNLEKIDKPLRFSGKVLGDIYLGKITRWNDAAIKEINPGVELPDLKITVIHRADGSGSTFIWTDYLSKVSPAFKTAVGAGPAVKFPVGTGARGTAGVANLVNETPGAIGYVELVHALQKKIRFGAVKNQEGIYLVASLEGVTAAAEGALKDVPEDLRFSLTDAPGKEAYPICGATWAVVYVRQPKDKAKAVQSFLRWMTHEGQEYATDLYYARLPKGLIGRIDKKLERIQAGK